MEDVSNFSNICPTNRIQSLNLHDFLYDFADVLQMIYLKQQKSMLVLGPHGKESKYSTLTLSQCTLAGPVYTGMPLVDPVYTGIPLGDPANTCRVYWNTTGKT